MNSRLMLQAPVLVCVLAGGNRAQSPEVAAGLEEAKALNRQGRYQQAVVKLQDAIARLERLRDLEARRMLLAEASLQLGFSYAALGDRTAALDAFKSAASLDGARRVDPLIHPASGAALFEQARRDVRAEGARSRQDESFGTLSVSSPAWIEVSVDSGPLQQTPLTMRLAPGRHVVRASRPGFRSEVFVVEISEGEASPLTIALRPEGGVR